MKLYNARNQRHRDGSSAGITFSVCGSSVVVNKQACKRMGYMPGDGLEIAYDDLMKEWYVRFTKVDGMPLRAGKRRSGSMTCGNSMVVRDFTLSMKQDPAEVKSIWVPLAKEPTEINGVAWYALITRMMDVRIPRPQAQPAHDR